MNPLLQTQDLCKSYRLGDQEIPVLRNIDLIVEKGDLLAIMGPSGSGKSTLLNILGCLDRPTSGSYHLEGHPVAALSESQLAGVRNFQIGFVFQNFNLLPKLDVWSNVELPLIYAGLPRRVRMEKVENSLRRLGILDRRKHRPNEISGGQKQRVAIARALVKSPKIIFADEPTGNLDSATTGDILKLLRGLNQEGNTILVITHEKEVARQCTRVMQLHDGILGNDAATTQAP